MRRVVGGHLFPGRTLGRDAEKEEQPRNPFLETRKILRSRQLARRQQSSWPCHPLQGGRHDASQCGVVDGDRIASFDVDLCPGAGTFCNFFRSGGDAPCDVSPHGFIEGADGAQQFHAFGNDVVAHAALDTAHGEDGRFMGDVELTALDGLQTQHYLGGHHDGIHPVPRHGAVGLASLDGDAQGV